MSIQDKAYGYDTVTNITSITDGVTPGDSQSFAYDDLDRLETDDGPYGDTDYVYDANGNRTSKVQVNGVTTTETTTLHSTSNRLNVSNGTTISHDAGGNQLNAAGSQVFEYNARNRMDVFRIGTTLTAEFEHNAYGQRVLKTVYGVSTDDIVFHFGLGGEILGTTTYLGGGGKRHVQVVWLDGKPVAQYTQAENGSGVITSTETVYLHTDHLDTPRLATGTSGSVKWRWEADAFGVGSQDTDPDNDSTDTYVNLRFPGQYYDDESGKHYNYFRTDDPSTGRYITSDPIGLLGGLNTYLYAEANPLRFTDPTGEAAIALPWVVPPLIEGLKWCAATLTFIAIAETCGDEDGCFGGDDDDPSCDEHFTRCLDSSLADLPGSVYGSSRCGVCRDQCVRNGGTWPDIAITGSGSVRCDYWNFQ